MRYNLDNIAVTAFGRLAIYKYREMEANVNAAK